MRAVVVGAGLAGIAATWALEQHGYECVLLESSDRIGGRMKTTTLGEHNVDEGFHVLHTAYPTLGRWLDIDRLELKPMDPATSLITPSSGRLQTLGDPLRAPLLMLPSLITAGLWNSLRMLRWRLKSKKKDLEYAMDHPTLSIDKGFESMRFSPSFRDSFLHPLFTGITLDNERRERTSFASFTWAAMSHGSMTMPKNGIQAVPEQLASQLKKDTIHYNTNVRSVSSSGVTLDNGETMDADLVVVAVPQHIANTWLDNPQQILRKQTATFVFEAEQSPLDKPRLLLNREYAQEEQNILHVHVPTCYMLRVSISLSQQWSVKSHPNIAKRRSRNPFMRNLDNGLVKSHPLGNSLERHTSIMHFHRDLLLQKVENGWNWFTMVSITSATIPLILQSMAPCALLSVYSSD